MKELIHKLRDGEELQDSECRCAAELLISESVEAQLKADFLKALHLKGETAEEIASFARAFLAHAKDPQIDHTLPLIDVCGTGGDGMNLFNVSSTSMFILAAGGAMVVKHGNRGITSRSGGADVLEALGIRIDLPAKQARACVEEIGIGFLFAPHYHPAFKAVAPVRRALAEQGCTSIFNLLGPLLNPAQPRFQLVGIFNPKLLDTYATVLGLLGRSRAWVLNCAGADEILPNAATDVVETTGPHSSAAFTIDPKGLGVAPCSLDELKGGSREDNAKALKKILGGTEKGPKLDTALLNAAAGFVITGISSSMETGLAFAREVVSSGAARQKIEQLREFSTA